MNYTILSSVSCLLALQKTLKFRISVGLSEVLVRPSDLHLNQSINQSINQSLRYTARLAKLDLVDECRFTSVTAAPRALPNGTFGPPL